MPNRQQEPFVDADPKVAPQLLIGVTPLTASASTGHGWMPDLEPSMVNRLSIDCFLGCIASPVPPCDIINLTVQLLQSFLTEGGSLWPQQPCRQHLPLSRQKKVLFFPWYLSR